MDEESRQISHEDLEKAEAGEPFALQFGPKFRRQIYRLTEKVGDPDEPHDISGVIASALNLLEKVEDMSAVGSVVVVARGEESYRTSKLDASKLAEAISFYEEMQEEEEDWK